ncbi:SAC3 family protein 1 [Cytospora mali]|uniref:SAC3 family protein 1 n=1 Tax=Cytospora mali TaxID=578113 RepID=A0A194W6A4_CYTMA|nr:SAC3 family protein 1 [Valsa mali]
MLKQSLVEDSLDEILSKHYATYKARAQRAIPEMEWSAGELPQRNSKYERQLDQSNLDSDPNRDPDQGPNHQPLQPFEDRPQTEAGGRTPEEMAGFGQAPVFGAQALSTDATNSPFGAPSNSSSPFGQPQQQTPIFGAPTGTTNRSFQQAQTSSPFGSLNSTTNVPAGNSSTGPVFGSSDLTNSGAMSSNPFAAATAAPAGMLANPFATPATNTSMTPFGTATPAANQNSVAAANPFACAASSSPFGTSSSPANGALSLFNKPSEASNHAASPFASATSNSQKRKNGFEGMGNSKRLAFDSTSDAFQRPNTAFANTATSNRPSGFGVKDTRKNRNGFADYLKEKEINGLAPISAPTQTTTVNGEKKKTPSVYSKEIWDQLRKDSIKPPGWPKQPGNPASRKSMEDHREKYKKYEGRVRASLVKAGLIDDPDVRKKLSDAIDFRGICEDMCPEGEKVSRIVEYDVKAAEKTATSDGLEMWPDPARMVKTFKRSAAGSDSPLPTEVRSPAALRRTVDYLIDDLLKSDENLPSLHNFLWDRTRAIRKDFIFQNAMSAEERTDQIYCLENIARFHAVALHLLSQEGFAADDFSEQQEREQLGKTLLSLMQVYDECKDMRGVQMGNEAEFRAYYLLFNAHDPFVMQQMQDWNDKFWFKSTEIQTVVALIEAMQNVWNGRGPLRPQVPLTTGSSSFTTYFSIVEDPQVSYTMACFAEIHFTEIRRHLLKSIHKAYGRVRDGPKDLTAKVLNTMFRFDTEDQCVAFLEELGMEFSPKGADEPYLVVERRRSIPGKTIRQSFSGVIVEPKRGDRLLPEVIHTTVFGDASYPTGKAESPNSMFVTQPSEMSVNGHRKQNQFEVNFSDEDSPSSTPLPPNNTLSPFQKPPSTNGFGLPDASKSVLGSAPANPFSSAPSIFNAPVDKSASTTPTPSFSWTSKPSSNIFSKPVSPESGAQAPTQLPPFPRSTTPPGAAPTTAPFGSGSGGAFDFLKKPTEASSAPLFPPSASSAGSTSIFSMAESINDQNKAPEAKGQAPKSQPGTTSTAVPPVSQDGPSAGTSIFSKPSEVSGSTATPSMFGTPQTATQQPNMATPFGFPAFSTTPAAKTPAPPPQTLARPKDMMGDFTKWVVLGDKGLMDEFQEALVEHLVRSAFVQYQKDEEERKRKEAEERSWAEARKFRKYSLRVKYFYRWRGIARKSALKRVGRQNRAAIKAYREGKLAEARAAKAKAEKEEQARVKRLTASSSSWLDELEKERALKRARRESMSLDTSRRSSFASTTRDALHTTGVFSGLRNERDMAAECVRDDDSLYDHLVGVSIHPNPSQTSMGPPARPKDPLRSVRNAAVSKPLPKPKLSRKAQYLQDLLNGKHKEDDLISFRSSTSSRLGQSVSAGGKVTNFSRYQSSSPRSSAEPERPRNGPGSGIKSSYWLLRSRGLFATPTGHVLSDKAPRPTSNAVYGGGSQYSGDSEAGDLDDRVLEQDGAYRASLGLTGARRSTFSVQSDAASPPRQSFLRPNPVATRQSLPTGGSAPTLVARPHLDGDAASQASVEGSTVSTIQHDVEESLRELRRVAAELDDETNWYREQNKQLSKG